MAAFKCKMCGGDLIIEQGSTVAECEYCGSKQTLPKLDDDRRANLYDRANHFRRNNEFDKAAGIYEQILNEDTTDAEAYWSLVLCQYGIEYVEDPATHKRVPTVNRAQFTSVFDDDNYKSALQYADGYQRELYEKEAKTINDIQKGILAISQKEEPFDVFICYKETDANGRRTMDSVLANDLYHQLTQEGFKVFFSRITLEDKLGTAYEPYIFAALNSAKVMVVLGTKPEYFNAIWVKNEWSRYLALVKQSGGKKVLIPAYRDMDPYDLPEEFSHLQAQDMSKLGFMQDLIRGIKKIAKADEPKAASRETVVVNSGNANADPLLRRAFMFLEDGEWQSADEYAEKVLDIDPENGEAYLAKAMSGLNKRTRSAMNDASGIALNANIQKALRFGSESLKNEINGYIAADERRRKAAEDAEAARRKAAEEAEAARRKAAEEAEAAAQLEADKVIAAFMAKQNGVKAQSLEQRLVSAKQKLSYIEQICGGYDKVAAQIRQYSDERAAANSRLSALRTKRDSLGLFAGKEKKRLDGEISEITTGLKQLDLKLTSAREQLGGFESKTAADRALSQARADVSLIQNRIDAVSISGSGEYSYSRALKVLQTKPRVFQIASEKQPKLVSSCQGFVTIPFGRYPQASKNENAPIEWLVLKIDGSRALLISKYALDCRQYNTSCANVTWETCTLRKWLNGTFLNAAFSESERAMIPTVTVDADKNPSWSTSPGNSTTDQIFLLSITEVNKYFSSNSARQCQGTAYCYAQGAHKAYNGNCWWWLRSPGISSDYAADVYYGGSVRETGRDVCNGKYAVRPALWINLGS